MKGSNDIDLIREITLLYELSLSVGHSFDLKENIHSFMKILMERKSIDMASVWLLSEFYESSPDKDIFKLVYNNPESREKVTSLKKDHPVVKKIGEQDSCSVSYQSPEFSDFITETGVFHGVYTVFKLADIGFIKLYQFARKYSWDKIERNQLVKVIRQFTYSIRSCIDHEWILMETSKRQKAEQQLQLRERQFLEVVNTIDDVFFSFNVQERRFTFISPGITSICGFEVEKLYADPSLLDKHIYHEGEEHKKISFINDILNSSKSDNEFKFVHPDQRILTIWLKQQRIRNNKGETIRIVGTMRDISEKNRILTNLEYRLLFEDLVLEISSSFINLTSTEIDNGIDDALRRIGEFTRADRSYIFLFHSGGNYMSNTHEWCADDVSPEIANLKNLPSDSFPWWMEKLSKHQAISIPKVNDLPGEASAERKHLVRQSIKSLVVIPLILRNKLRGFIGFDFVREEVSMNQDMAKLLWFVGQIVINAIDRKVRGEEQ